MHARTASLRGIPAPPARLRTPPPRRSSRRSAAPATRPVHRGLAAALPLSLLLLTASPGLPGPLAGPPVRAQETPPDSAGAQEGRAGARTPVAPARRFPELTVTVGRAEERLRRAVLPISVVDASGREERERGTSLKEVLAAVPGVQVSDRRNFSLGDRITVRGAGARAQFGVRGVEILADGVPLTLPDGQATLTNLDLGSAQRVEVLRGPASALYGNASGGVVRVRSGGFAPEPLAVRPRLLVGEHGFRKEELRASGSRGSLSYLFHGSHLETDGFREHARAETYRANLVLDARLAPGSELRTVVNAFHMPFGQNPGTLGLQDALLRPETARDFLVAQGAGESSTQLQAGLTLEQRLGTAGQLRAAAWGLTRDLRNPIPGRIIDLERSGAGVRVELRGGRGDGGWLRWTAGFDAELQRDDRRETENLGVAPGGDRARSGAVLLSQAEDVDALGPFARLQVVPAKWLSVTVAGRYDRYRFAADDRLLSDGDDSGQRVLEEVSPALGAAVTPAPWLALYGNLATAFETPTTSELSNRPDGAGGLHPTLGPQTTLSVEAGARGTAVGGALSWDLALFDARVRDALVPFAGPSEQVFFRNAGEISRQGAEVSVGWRPTGRLATRLAYSHLDARFETFAPPSGDASGHREPGAPVHRLVLAVRHRWPFGLTAEANLDWTDAYPVNDQNTAWTWSSRVVDVRLSLERDLGRWRLGSFVGVDNLLDERYNAAVVPNAFGGRYYEPGPGREVFGGLRVGLPPL